MDTEKDKNVSCFALDGVVAEMVIEVEDTQKPGYDDFKDLASSPSKNFSPIDEDVDSENKVNDAEVAPIEVLPSEKKEDKENIIDIPEASHYINDNENENDNNIPIIKKDRKRKCGVSFNHDANEKISDLPRYPGRKRQANKRYISDDMITSIADKSESVQSKETLKGEKRRKLDTDFKDVKSEKFVPPRKSNRNGKEESAVSVMKSSNTKEESFHMKDEPGEVVKDECLQIQDWELEMEEIKTKQKILRKLPFRKNRDAPDVPDLKPKVFWWNGVGEGMGIKLGDLPEVKKRIKGAKSIRALYRVLFFQWPTNGQDLVGQILNFNGFPFDKASYEFTKRQSLMKIMLDLTISNMCDILGVKKGSKATMINNILNFLLKPNGKIDPSLDPCMQPVVLLERIVLDDKFFQKSPESVKSKKITGNTKTKMCSARNKEKVIDSTSITPVRTTRNSLSKQKIFETPTSKKTSVKAKVDMKASSGKAKFSTSKGIEPTVSKTAFKEKTTIAVKDNKSSSKGDKPKAEERAKSDDGIQKSGNENDAPNKIKTIKKLKKRVRKSKSGTKNKVTSKKSSDNASKNEAVDSDIEMEVDVEPSIEESVGRGDGLTESTVMEEKDNKEPEKESKSDFKARKLSGGILSDSSETESAEETKLVTASKSVPKSSQKLPQKRKGKPLKMFSKISESIQKANFSALQRLHILLFGASDKAENLKGNILAFGGFPFLEGSDEWKQKHFLLSLLAQNNLREYLKLLCIEYSDDDQPTMISKLMQFLAAPSESVVESKSPQIETEVASPEVTNKKTEALPKKSKLETKKKNVKKKEEKKPNGRRRKVLMSEEEARRLEASFAREQRALARDSRAPPPITRQPTVADPCTPLQPQLVTPNPPKPPVTDPNQLNALIQTVYKRRALKAAGAVISTPNKGEKIKLGDIENIKFLVVTSNIRDLEVLHQLIYMLPASKSRLRKNILDFDGFGFNEDSNKYKERMDLLNSLGYEMSKRLSFILGLCPFLTDIHQQDLNELIMYFLMSPCKSKQVVPITQMPVDPTIGLPEENHIILKTLPEVDKNSHGQAIFRTIPESTRKVPEISIRSSASIPPNMRQKAKKSFSSSLKLSPVKKVLLPPAASSAVGRTLSFNPKQSIGSIPKSVAVLNSVHALPTFSLPKTTVHNTGSGISLLNNPGNVAVLNASKSPNVNTLIKVPVVNPGSKLQLMNQASKVAVLDAATKIPMSSIPHIAGQILQNPVIFPNVSGKVNVQPQQNVSSPVLPGSKMLVRTPGGVSSPQEFLVQQQTPDGQQKTFKLIRLPPNHPLASAVKPPVQQSISTPQVQQPVIITSAPLRGSSLPPGIVVMKNSSPLQLPGQNVQNVLQTVPLKVNIPFNKPNSSVVTTSPPNTDEFVLPDQGESAGTSGNDPDIEILNPLEDNPPTDVELYSSIQEIILSSNFEDITLRNVIERVSSQFPHHDLTHRHNFMKDCVKKIIIGT